MPRNIAGLIIATYKGVQVDWPVMIADVLSATIVSVKDGKKMWTVVAQWLTLLAGYYMVMPVTESTPKTASKRQQLLATQAIGWKEADTSQKAKERPNRKVPEEKEASVNTPVRPVKIKLRQTGQQVEQQPDKP